jgi:hypothetical protein
MNLQKTRGIEVKGNGSGTNHRYVKVDCHCLEEDGGTSRRLEVGAEEEVLMRSRSCSSGSPPEREYQILELRVGDKCSGEKLFISRLE